MGRIKTERMIKFEQDLINLVQKYTGINKDKLLLQQITIYSGVDEIPKIEINGIIF